MLPPLNKLIKSLAQIRPRYPFDFRIVDRRHSVVEFFLCALSINDLGITCHMIARVHGLPRRPDVKQPDGAPGHGVVQRAAGQRRRRRVLRGAAVQGRRVGPQRPDERLEPALHLRVRTVKVELVQGVRDVVSEARVWQLGPGPGPRAQGTGSMGLQVLALAV